MIIGHGFQPSCSEATVYISVDNITDKKAQDIVNEIVKMIEKEYNGEQGDNEVYRDTIFGMKIITVKGDYPYNYESNLVKYLNKKKLAWQ